MDILFRLLANLIQQFVGFGLKIALDLVGCAVRLLYWSVRQYGWFAVLEALGALTLGLLWRRHHGGLAFTEETGLVVGGITLGLITASRTVRWLVGAAPGWYRQRRLVGLGRRGSRVAGSGVEGLGVGGRPSPITPHPSPLWDPLGVGPLTAPPTGASVGPAAADPSLWAQLLAPATLQRAWERVAANGGAPGADGVRVEDFAAAWPQHLAALQADLARGTYRPLPPKTFTVPKRSGGVRQLSIPTLRDRIVQQALTLVLTPLFEPHFAPCSFAYRPGRSAHHALKQVEDYLRRGRRWVLDADIASFFDTVDLAVLRGLLRRRITDERILALIAQDLEVGARRPGVGIAQGSATSPLWANVYLDVFDGALLDAGQALVRYADDFVVLAESREQAEAALALTQAVLWEPLRLRLNPDKTRIASLQEGFVFLGFHFSPAGRRPCDEAWESLHEQMQHCAAHTPAPALGERLRRLVQGWRGYFGTPEEEIWQREGIAPMFTANETSDRVQKLLDGCRVLRYLAEKPQRTHHLNHTERLVLLYTFGRLGAEGEAFLHRVLQPCANYSPQTTQKWINRLEPGHPPLSCARLRDWLGDLGPDFPCDCFPNLPRGVYPSPVRWAQPEAPRPEPVEVLRWGPAEGEGGDWKLEMGDGKVENGRAAPLGRPAAAEPEGTEDGEVEAPGRAAPLGRPAVAGEPEGTEDGEWGETLWREVAEDLFAEPEAIQVGEGT